MPRPKCSATTAKPSSLFSSAWKKRSWSAAAAASARFTSKMLRVSGAHFGHSLRQAGIARIAASQSVSQQ